MRLAAALSFATLLMAAGGGNIAVRPPQWTDPDNRPVPKPGSQEASELYAILNNSWLRHLSPEYEALSVRNSPALNVNAWDEVPDSSWFTGRIGRRAMAFEEIVSSLGAIPPAPPPWTVVQVEAEGYTPKLRVRDSANHTYILKFDLPEFLERNSGAERISTLVFHAAGYNVPGNTIAYFRAGDIRIDAAKSKYVDAFGKERPMTEADLRDALSRLKPLPDGRYRGLASPFLPGSGVGKWLYTGTRKDDANDLIPHELRRELRGMRVLAAWANHVDAGDKNTFDSYIGKDGEGFLRHYLIDFGSSLGSGNFVNGPFRVGHEYIFDGAAMSRALLTLGAWRRPWERRGVIRYPEIGYYQAELFDPPKWKPNYPNLAFERMDDADAYWGAKIVTAFSDELIQGLAEAGGFTRAEVTSYLADVLRRRRDAIGHYWFDRVTALEQFELKGERLSFRDLALDRGYAGREARGYRLWVEGGKERTEFDSQSVQLPQKPLSGLATPDRFGRIPLARLWIQARRRDGGWALPVEVILGRNRDRAAVEAIGWRHGVR
jgi:hypothetical protein